MAALDIKTLKKLADACRKAGITHFKSAEFEFSLGEAPVKERKVSKSKEVSTSAKDEIQTSELSPEDLLFWSAMSDAGANGEESKT